VTKEVQAIDMTSATEAVRVPDTLEEVVSPAWLTAALRRYHPEIVVRSSSLGPVVARVSTNARFHIEYEGAVGVPRDLCVKGYFGEEQAASRRAGEQEAYFYRDLAKRSQVRTLRVVWADADPVTHHGVVITEDVVAEGGRFLDALSPYSPEQAAGSLEQYAILHGRTWAARDLPSRHWLTNRSAALLATRGLQEIAGNFGGPIGAGVPEPVRDADRLLSVARSLRGTVSEAEPWCVIHGDAHIGNFFLDAAGRPNLVDWQNVSRGPWYLDVGYHMASALTVEDRRRSERDLLGHYLDLLHQHGGDAPPWDEAWRSLRIGIIYGFYLWAITLKVAPPITTELLKRLGTAALDHKAFAVADEI
jgi:hypothetical protein